MNEELFTAEYLEEYRQKLVLPRAEQREQALRILALGPIEEEAPSSRGGLRRRLTTALTWLGERMIAAGGWLAQPGVDLASPRT